MKLSRPGSPAPGGERDERSNMLWVGIGLVLACWVQSAALASGSPDGSGLVLNAKDIRAVRAQSGGLLLSGQAGGSVNGSLIWSLSSRGENGRVEVPFAVEVDHRGEPK